MRIGILGATGPAGGGLAARLASVGHEVLFGSRSAEKAEHAVAELQQKWGERLANLHPCDNAAACDAPHAHLRNKSWLIEVIDPDGRRQPILSVPKFDFNWQLVYRLAEPLPVRAGSRLHAVGVFDNSANNKNNPDPAAEVRWGNFTNDEMLFASIVYSLTPGAQTSGQR